MEFIKGDCYSWLCLKMFLENSYWFQERTSLVGSCVPISHCLSTGIGVNHSWQHVATMIRSQHEAKYQLRLCL
jgi:hypothetical protein